MPKKSKIRDTEWEPVIRRFIAAGWSSTSIADYMEWRYGQKLSSSTVRYYKSQEIESIEEEWANVHRAGHLAAFVDEKGSRDDLVDVAGRLTQLAELQERRIAIDASTERTINKLFETLGPEIDRYAKILMQLHEVYQDYGIAPKAGMELNVGIRTTEQAPSKETMQLPSVWEAPTAEDREALIRLTRLAFPDQDEEIIDAEVVEEEE